MAKKVTPHPKPKRARHYLREWRKHRGLTQEQLAERINTTASTISQLENGQINYTQPTLEALAYALMCEPGDLLSRDPLISADIVDLLQLLAKKDPQMVLTVVRALPDKSGTGP